MKAGKIASLGLVLVVTAVGTALSHGAGMPWMTGVSPAMRIVLTAAALGMACTALLFPFGIANVVAAPDIKSFILAANIVAAIVSGIIGSIFSVSWARSPAPGD